uniref:small monomeric GTPase n=1 Tax=Cyclopterus lumpus TaxID=8103 RepID=A0A8C3AW06_CYCLU
MLLNAAFHSFHCLEGYLLGLVSHTVVAVHRQALVKDPFFGGGFCAARDLWPESKYSRRILIPICFLLTVFLQTILVGDSGVGKTSLLVQFDQGKFIPGSFSATVGIGFTNKVVTVDDVKVQLQIWDTAGQERFRSVTHAYYRDAHALLLLYDITSKTSFDNIRAWLTEIHEYAQSDVVIMLLGNKADMSSVRAIRRDEGERLAREYSVPFMETSAKTGVNVELAFTAVSKYET